VLNGRSFEGHQTPQINGITGANFTPRRTDTGGVFGDDSGICQQPKSLFDKLRSIAVDPEKTRRLSARVKHFETAGMGI
jgi:hypothetical protein